MKLNKYFLLIGIAIAGILSSCSDDDDYHAGPRLPAREYRSEPQAVRQPKHTCQPMTLY